MMPAFVRIVCVLHLLAIALMVATGLVPVLAGGAPHGYTLLIHGVGSVLYLATLAGFGVVAMAGTAPNTLARVLLAVTLWSGVVAGGAMLLAMLPLFETPGQLTLIAIHRWSSLSAAVAGGALSLVGLLVRPLFPTS